MTEQLDLERNPWPLAADLIVKRGWTTGTEEDADGHVCIEGAVRLCAPVPGDGPIYREVVSHRGKGAVFNDATGTSEADVLNWLRIEAAPITDDELLEVFGPQWREVVALVRTAARFTDEQRSTYWRAVDDAWKSTEFRDAWHAVGVGGGPGGAARLAVGAVGGGGGGAGVGAALARRHEIGTAFTQEQYDLVCAPWVSVTGQPVHPDDQVSAAA